MVKQGCLAYWKNPTEHVLSTSLVDHAPLTEVARLPVEFVQDSLHIFRIGRQAMNRKTDTANLRLSCQQDGAGRQPILFLLPLLRLYTSRVPHGNVIRLVVMKQLPFCDKKRYWCLLLGLLTVRDKEK